MREIKFRAWKFNIVSESYEMREWDSIKNNCMQFFTNPEKFNDFTPNKKGHVIMQFTGLKDKNGKDIYEGDILKRGEDVSFVVWQLDHWCLNSYMQVGRGLYANVDKTRHKGFEIAEIIGNIHENPELLR